MRHNLAARFLAQLEDIGWEAHVIVLDLWRLSFGFIWFTRRRTPTNGDGDEQVGNA